MKNTINLTYIIEGNGFPVVLLHGFCESKEIWKDFISPLAGICKVIVPDMPGFGESKGSSNYQSVEQLAGEVYGLLQNLGINKCIVIGHSLGGYVALALAEENPEVLQGLGLFHSTAYADSEEKKHTRNKAAEFIANKGIEPFVENLVPGLFYKGRRQELADIIEWVCELSSTTPPLTAVAVTKAMRDRPDRTHILEQLNVPILFIAGREDESVPFEESKEQFSLPKNPILHVLDHTAHMGMFERPEATLQMVKDFIKVCTEKKEKNAY